MQKACESARHGATVVALLPHRSDTIWWHRYIEERPGVEIRPLKKRLKFGGSQHNAAFPSVLVIFRPPQGR